MDWQWDDQEGKPTDEYAEEMIGVIESHLSQLREHFDTVQIVVTKHWDDERGTCACWLGHGNWHARLGSAIEMLRNMRRNLR
jgi:hypothetical protein